MKQRLSDLRGVVITACLATFGLIRTAGAQTGTLGEGAVDLIRAMGARSLGVGQATTAVPLGTESVWSNPALIARGTREGSLDFRTKGGPAEPESDLAAALLWPVPSVGSLAVFARYTNYGTQDVADAPSPIGSFSTTSLIIGATGATTFFDRLAVGFTVKQLQYRFPCTGDCTRLGTGSADRPSVTAFDLGAQYHVFRDSSLKVGIAMLNLGPRLQIIDSPQADSIPSRISWGAAFDHLVPSVPGLRARISADVVWRLTGGGPGQRFGGELTYLDRFHVRAGYIVKGEGEVDTPTLGFGVSSGKVRIDFAQMMSGLSTQTQRPSFFALRYAF